MRPTGGLEKNNHYEKRKTWGLEKESTALGKGGEK